MHRPHGIIVLAALMTIESALAQDIRAFPTELYGVPVGQDFNLTTESGHGIRRFPAAEIVAIEDATGVTFPIRIVNFKPLREWTGYSFKTWKFLIGGIEWETSSFKAILYPVIPDTIQTLSDLDLDKLKWRVVELSWWLPHGRDTEIPGRYAKHDWAEQLCESVSHDLGIKLNESWNKMELQEYMCSISGDELSIEISSTLGRRFQMSLNSQGDLGDAAKQKILALKFEESRPYE